MSSKRQMTMAKMQREQAVRERRAKKLEKKQAKKRAAAEPSTEAAPAEVAETIDAPPETDASPPL
jgi:hypothetical protein